MLKKSLTFWVIVMLSLGAPTAVVAGAAGSDREASQASSKACKNPSTYAATQNCLHLNQIQVIGSHNSYHLRGQDPFWSAFESFVPDIARTLDYTHPALARQFSEQSVRQIELDVVADPKGGRFAEHKVLTVVNLPTRSPDKSLLKPGFKVLHVPEIDWETTCSTLRTCLTQVKSWSDKNPGHAPLAILLELKDDATPDPLKLDFVQPLPFTGRDLDALDALIQSVFPSNKLITPDLVRGKRKTLDAAVTKDGWPTLEDSRGKVMFLMDNESGVRDLYLKGHKNLAGRAIFTASSPGKPDAAFIKSNDPTGDNTAKIQDLVRRGYVVRTRSDADTEQARTGDTTQRDLALSSGAQWVSTDYPTPADGARFGTGYFASIPGGTVARCNPVNGPTNCRSKLLERLR